MVEMAPRAAWECHTGPFLSQNWHSRARTARGEPPALGLNLARNTII